LYISSQKQASNCWLFLSWKKIYGNGVIVFHHSSSKYLCTWKGTKRRGLTQEGSCDFMDNSNVVLYLFVDSASVVDGMQSTYYLFDKILENDVLSWSAMIT
jgi:hypothetical protein